MKLIDVILESDFEKISFAEATSKLAKVNDKAETVSEVTKKFFGEYISDDFWRNEHEKEASV